MSYRALKLEFDLTEDHLEALKEELVDMKRLAMDENGQVRVWTNGKETEEKEKRGIGDL